MAFESACELAKGDNETFKVFLIANPEVINKEDRKGVTLMHHAATGNCYLNIQTLVDMGCMLIDKREKDYRQTPIYYAAINGCIETIEKLMSLGCKTIDSLNWMNRTPLFSAVDYQKHESVETLVRLGSQAIDTHSIYDGTPLHMAATRNDSRMIKLLLRLGSTSIDSLDNRDVTPLGVALMDKNFDAFTTLIQHGSQSIDTSEPKNKNNTLMHYAAILNGTAVKLLMRFGSKSLDTPNDDGHTPLHLAFFEKLKNVDILLHLGASRMIDLRHNIMQSYKWRTTFKLELFCSRMQNKLDEPLDEDAAHKTRYEVYFCDSLVSRLLFELKRRSHIQRMVPRIL
jgi:ankyrin repeat protein